MSTKTTIKDLNIAVTRLNKVTNSPLEPYTRNEDGKFRANVGNYHLDFAYGGCTLGRMTNLSGGVSRPLPCGFVTKRELLNLINAYIYGIESVQP